MKLDIDYMYIYDNYNVEQFNTVVLHSMINHYDHDMVFRCRSTHNPNRQWVYEVLLCMCVFQMISHADRLYVIFCFYPGPQCECRYVYVAFPDGRGNNRESQWHIS